MKKAILASVLMVALAMPSAFSLGLGLAATPGFGGGGADLGGLALTFKLDELPYVFTVDARINSAGFGIGAQGDLWMWKGPLAEFINWYAGPGLYAGIFLGNGWTGINAGVRFPLGLNTFLLNKKLELFCELAPAVGLAVNSAGAGLGWGIQGAFGFRYYF